ncbi:type II secretion system protein J [Synechococcus sp. GFB01]|uniref:PulJ/GspJ family protein n=1 Tax=Synechococcus sp. GFB01 TaxID=1662190 RepID=UPI00064F322B|nr:prepilin-type N-terminal cleavage/methylation domain-containing protein [Synechococcus sp. GFB01]KMM16873.1 hypothetical protein SYNGFB01_08050 [Synechococcus sp. GFB01]
MTRHVRAGRRSLAPLPGGFSLPELLVATAIAALVVVGTAQVMIGQLQEGQRLEAAQRRRENFSRLNYLIAIEASESEEVELGVSPPGCDLGAVGFTLWIPKPAGTYAQAANRSGIQYANLNNDIVRCGPRVSQNGQLVHSTTGNDGSTSVTSVVVPNAQLTVGGANVTAGRQIAYQVNFIDGNLGTAGATRVVVAHARSVFVCNPPVTGIDQVGDC